MATSLQQQLAVIAANSTHQLDLKAQKQAHGRSLLFDSKVAVSQDFNTLYRICIEGFEDLCRLDARFQAFEQSIFSEQSKSEERGMMTAEENKALDGVLESFLTLVSGRLLLKPAQKAVEWVIRRFRVHEHNTACLVLAFLPYHATPLFLSLLSILPKKIPLTFRFLHPSIQTLQNPPSHTLIYTATTNTAFFTAYNHFILGACRERHQAPALMSFWAGLVTQAVDGMLSSSKSGRQSIQKQAQEDLLLRVLPLLNEAFSPKMADVTELVLAACMIVTILGAKGYLEDQVLDGLMEAVAGQSSPDTAEARMTCMAVLAEQREALELSKSCAKKLSQQPGAISQMTSLRDHLPVGRLVLGLVLRDFKNHEKSKGLMDPEQVRELLQADLMSEEQLGAACKKIFRAIVKADEVTGRPAGHTPIASQLIEYMGTSAEHQETLHRVLKSLDVERSSLESTLQITLPSVEVRTAITDADGDLQMLDEGRGDDFEDVLSKIQSTKLASRSFLDKKSTEDYALFKAAFLRTQTSNTDVNGFLAAVASQSKTEGPDATSLTLLLRLALDHSMKQAPRATALRCVKQLFDKSSDILIPAQFALPYLLAALTSSQLVVRQAAGEVLAGFSKAESKDNADIDKNFQSIYQWRQMPAKDSRQLLGILVPHLEEIVLDPGRMLNVFAEQTGTSTKTKSSKKTKSASDAGNVGLEEKACDYFADHAVGTTLFDVKLTMLKLMNQVGGASSITTFDVLEPMFKKALTSPVTLVDMDQKRNDTGSELDLEIMRTITVENGKSMEALEDVISVKGDLAVREIMVRPAFRRLAEIWSSLSPDMKEKFIEALLESSLKATNSPIHQEAASDTLRGLKLPGSILAKLLDDLSIVSTSTEGPPVTKRRRTSRTEKARVSAPSEEDFAAGLAKYTLVLELVEASSPRQHPELLPALFRVLEELHNFRQYTRSGLVYLQGLTLNCLLAIVDGLKDKKSNEVDLSAIRVDWIVDCIQHSSNAQVQSTALLLISSLASWQPETVVQSIMPIFTFMGSTILRQADDYSAHVTDQTIKKVVPPLVESFRKKNKDIVVGASSLLLSFTAAFEHIPQHRRLDLFEHVARTVGAEESLYAIVALLVDGYPADARAKRFAAELVNRFEPEIGLRAVRDYLRLVGDMFRPRHTTSQSLLNIQERAKETHEAIADNLLVSLNELLRDPQLRKRVTVSFQNEDIDAANAQRRIALELIQEGIRQSQFLRSKPELTSLAGTSATVLSSIINLLPVIELIQFSKSLLVQKDDEVRLVALRSSLNAVRELKNPDKDELEAVLGMLGTLTGLLGPEVGATLAGQAIVCAGQIIRQFGKKDTGAVVAAAQVIAGEHGLKNKERAVQLASVDCLTVAIKVLKDEFIPLVPEVLPAVFDHVKKGIANDPLRALNIIKSCMGLISAVTENLPFLMTGDYLDTTVGMFTSTAASQTIAGKAREERSGLQRLLTKHVDAAELYAAYERKFAAAAETGSAQALAEYLAAVKQAITARSKSTIVKNANALFEILLQAFDIRRSGKVEDEEEIEELQQTTNDVALTMVMKLNDATFRPFIVKLAEWATALPKKNQEGRLMRAASLFSFLTVLFGRLKALVTSYTNYVLDLAVDVLSNVMPEEGINELVLQETLAALEQSFTHDDESFWHSPHHFTPIATPLTTLLERAALASFDLVEATQWTILALASAAAPGDQHKALNQALLKLLRHEDAKVRRVAVDLERRLTEEREEEWMAMMPEMLPFVSELLEDDDKLVERGAREWIRVLEAGAGESIEF